MPVIRHAEKLSLIELAQSISENVKKAREGRAGSEELQGSTFSITNLGAFGVEHFTPILNPPETGILGIGASYDTPVYQGEEIVRSTILPLSLTFDHRACDGCPCRCIPEGDENIFGRTRSINFIGKAGENDMTLAIIGGGPAGYAAAVSAAQQGRNVLLIDKGKLGGPA